MFPNKGMFTNFIQEEADSDDSEDSEKDFDDSDDSDDSDEEKEEKPAPSNKRKAEDSVDATPKKQMKTDNTALTLFCGSLSWGVDDDMLYEAFKDFEGLASARVVTDKNSGRSKGFGYVDFNDGDSCTKAYEAMQGKEIDGRALNLDYANAKPADSTPRDRAGDRAKKFGDALSDPTDTLWVGNLPFDTDQDTVRALFEEVTDVASVRLPTDPDSGNLKGFGYVSFNSIDDAKAALEAKNGAAIGNGRMSRTLRLDFAGARPPPRDGNGGGFGGRGGGRGGGREVVVSVVVAVVAVEAVVSVVAAVVVAEVVVEASTLDLTTTFLVPRLPLTKKLHICVRSGGHCGQGRH